MGFDFAAAKAQLQRTVHDTLAVEATHTDTNGVQTLLRVRWHTKQVLDGDLSGEGYASIIEGIDTIIFDRDELNEKGITLERGNSVAFADGAVLILDSQAPTKGPVRVPWRVVQQ